MKLNILQYKNPHSLYEIIQQHYQLDDEAFSKLSDFELTDPMKVFNMEKCVSILKDVKANDEKILICGDYDCDGICSTAILCKAFEAVGLNYGFYIPHRINEGYGLSLETVKKAHEKGYQNIITVDNGVSSFEAMQFMKEHRMRFILTDHHKFENREILCDCMIHPFLQEDDFSVCSGAGMALQVARCLIPQDHEIVAWAAISCIADCMPFTKENRRIIRKGIEALNQGVSPAIHALKNKPEDIFDVKYIAFNIVPKINSVGRLADYVNANNAVRYLLLKDSNAILNTARQINQINDMRKEMTSKMEKIANGELKQVPFEVIASSSFHEGIVGLVASRMVNTYHRPFLILSELKDEYKGSMRSVEGFDIVKYFDDFEGFKTFGGHAQAAGVSLKKEKLEHLLSFIKEHPPVFETIEEKMDVVYVCEDALDIQSVLDYMQLAPFGNGFEEIVFYIENIQIQNKIALSNGKYYKVVSTSGIEYLFFRNNLYDRIQDGMNLIGKIRVSEFKGMKQVNMVVDDVMIKAIEE